MRHNLAKRSESLTLPAVSGSWDIPLAGHEQAPPSMNGIVTLDDIGVYAMFASGGVEGFGKSAAYAKQLLEDMVYEWRGPHRIEDKETATEMAQDLLHEIDTALIDGARPEVTALLSLLSYDTHGNAWISVAHAGNVNLVYGDSVGFSTRIIGHTSLTAGLETKQAENLQLAYARVISAAQLPEHGMVAAYARQWEVTSALGMGSGAVIDAGTFQVEPGSRLAILSPDISYVLPPEAVYSYLNAAAHPQAIANLLAYNARSTLDAQKTFRAQAAQHAPMGATGAIIIDIS